MVNFFDVEIDIENKTLEELEAIRKKLREMLIDVSLQIEMQQIQKRRYSSSGQ